MEENNFTSKKAISFNTQEGGRDAETYLSIKNANMNTNGLALQDYAWDYI